MNVYLKKKPSVGFLESLTRNVLLLTFNDTILKVQLISLIKYNNKLVRTAPPILFLGKDANATFKKLKKITCNFLHIF